MDTQGTVVDVASAIQAHSNWKLRLGAACRGGSSEKIDVATLAKDNVCDLGKWLHGMGRTYASHAQYQDLVSAHAAFHRAAAGIAEMIQHGQAAKAETLVNSRESEFGKHSMRVVSILMAFRNEFAKG